MRVLRNRLVPLLVAALIVVSTPSAGFALDADDRDVLDAARRFFLLVGETTDAALVADALEPGGHLEIDISDGLTEAHARTIAVTLDSGERVVRVELARRRVTDRVGIITTGWPSLVDLCATLHHEFIHVRRFRDVRAPMGLLLLAGDEPGTLTELEAWYGTIAALIHWETLLRTEGRHELGDDAAYARNDRVAAPILADLERSRPSLRKTLTFLGEAIPPARMAIVVEQAFLRPVRLALMQARLGEPTSIQLGRARTAPVTVGNVVLALPSGPRSEDRFVIDARAVPVDDLHVVRIQDAWWEWEAQWDVLDIAPAGAMLNGGINAMFRFKPTWTGSVRLVRLRDRGLNEAFVRLPAIAYDTVAPTSTDRRRGTMRATLTRGGTYILLTRRPAPHMQRFMSLLLELWVLVAGMSLVGLFFAQRAVEDEAMRAGQTMRGGCAPR